MRLKNIYKKSKIVRWYKFKKKIREQLPNYNGKTGEPYKWRISIFSKVVGYYTTTGAPIRKKHPVIFIKQIRPVTVIDPPVSKTAKKLKVHANTIHLSLKRLDDKEHDKIADM